MSDPDKSTDCRLSAIQTRELLTIASETPETPEDWMIDVSDWELLEMILTDMCRGSARSGAPLLNAVCSPDTPLDLLVQVKDLAKDLTRNAQDMRQEAAGKLLYHLAVASALGFHDRNISSMEAAAHLPLYREFVAEISDAAISAVFEKAVDRMTLPRT